MSALDNVTGIFGTALTGIVAVKGLEVIGNMLKDIPSYNHPNYEVAKIKKDNTTGETLGYVKANSREEAVEKLQKHRSLPDKVRVYPIKITPKKKIYSNKVFDFDHYFNYDFVGMK